MRYLIRVIYFCWLVLYGAPSQNHQACCLFDFFTQPKTQTSISFLCSFVKGYEFVSNHELMQLFPISVSLHMPLAVVRIWVFKCKEKIHDLNLDSLNKLKIVEHLFLVLSLDILFTWQYDNLKLVRCLKMFDEGFYGVRVKRNWQSGLYDSESQPSICLCFRVVAECIIHGIAGFCDGEIMALVSKLYHSTCTRIIITLNLIGRILIADFL